MEAVTEEQLVELESLVESLPALPWELWTSNSFRRIHNESGEILGAYVQRGDGHPDLSMSEANLFKLVRLINSTPTFISTIRAQREALEKAKRLADLHFEPWGAAKGEEWEQLSGDLPFSSENTVLAIQRALSLTKEPSK